MAKETKSALHHWWPRTLSKHWANSKGGVTRPAPNGEVLTAKPSAFGAETNTHTIKIGPTESVFDESFEHQFQKVDEDIDRIVRKIRAALTGVVAKPNEIVPLAFNDDDFLGTLALMISLVVRGPQFRASIDRIVQGVHREAGDSSYKTPSKLIALNMRDASERFAGALGGRGKMLFAYSPNREFIFGDGFFHNYFSPSSPPLSPKIVLPLLPDVSIFFARPPMYSTEPRVSGMTLSEQQVALLNDTVQVYSEKWIFFRQDQPAIAAEFSSGNRMMYRDHTQPQLDEIFRRFTGRRAGQFF